jgi:LysM repeat protein
LIIILWTEVRGQKASLKKRRAKIVYPAFYVLLPLLFLATSAQAPAEKVHSESDLPYTIHSLQKGETLWDLAISHYADATFAALLAEYNNIADVNRIPVGSEIRIPHEILYEVKQDDSLSQISQQVLGTWKKYLVIAEYNHISDPNFIVAGQTLKIPLIPVAEKPAIPPEEAEPVEEPEVVEEEVPPAEEEAPAPVEEEKIEEEVPVPAEPEKPEEEAPPEEEVAIPVEEKPEKEPIPVEEEAPEPPIEEKPEEEVPSEEEIAIPVEEKPELPVEEEEVKEPVPPEEKEEKPPVIPPVRKDLRLTEVRKPIFEEKEPEEVTPAEGWPPVSDWIREKPEVAITPPKEEIVEPERLSTILDVLSRWDRPEKELYLDELGREGRAKERGVQLPMHSLLQIEGYKSITIQYNKTHYFGDSDINRYSGYYSGGGFDSGYYGYDSGYGSYGTGYNSYGSSSYGYGGSSMYGGYGSGYGSYGYGGYGYGYGGREGPNIEQELDIHLHGRIGLHTHVDVDYNDTGRSQFGGMGRKEQKIAVWYEGDEEDIIQRASFGDIRLNLPSSRFLNMSRDLFGAELVMQFGDLRVTAFGTRTKGIKETWTSKGQSRRAGGGTGSRIMDVNYIKERYYALNVGEDGLIYDSYLPIETGSEQIFIDDGIGTNNDSGVSTAQGYFDYQYPGEDYSIDYTTGQIEFLKNVSTTYKIVVAYKYRGDGGGTVGNPEVVFADDDEDGVIDESDDPADPFGYVVIKEKGQHGSELRNVYSLGNRNIGRRNFELSVWREGGTDSFETDDGPVAYIRIFGLDSDDDGLVDPELIDFEKGLLTCSSPRPFMIDDPESPYYEYRDALNNEAIYSENPSYSDQKYVIQADYSYQMPSFYLGRLNILPESEEVKVNGRRLQRNVDYMMIYEVGSIEIFKELDEYDEITIDYEYMPFGGQFQQTIAGIWAEYSFTPRKKEKKPEPQKTRPDLYGDEMSPFSRDTSTLGTGYDSYRQSSRYDSYGSGYDSYYSSYGYGSSGGRRGRYGGLSSSSRRPMTRSYGPRSEGLNLSLGYIYNTGERVSVIPDVNSAPSRLQALVLGGNWGHKFNVAKALGVLPFVSIQGEVPLSISLDGEAAYSRNNPNSVGYAMIDSMEGAKESSRVPTYKFSWQIGSVPIASDADIAVDNRAVFHVAPRDKDASHGNYMKNRETSAVEINPLSRSTQRTLVMEIGYEFDENASWGSLSYPVSGTGADFSEHEFLEIWMKVEGDDNVDLHLDFGVVSEDADDDFRLDSEDLPRDLIDQNGDHKIDILDLSKEDLPEEHKYKGNGSLDLGEDIGWIYNDFSGAQLANIGKDNSVMDKEDLDGDVVLDMTNSYYEFTIPLNDIPEDWVRKKTSNTGWMFLSIPLEAALPQGRSPSWAVVKHVRLWLEKAAPGGVAGKFQWYSIVVAGNRWEKGLVVDETGKLSENLDDEILVGAKNNQEFEDYLEAYRQIEHNKDFEDLHPYVESAFAFEEERKEQSLTLDYSLQPASTGYTMRELSGLRRGDGQDFSKHRSLRFWLYGDGSRAVFTMRLGSNVDDFGAGSPVTKQETDQTGQYPGYPSYSYSYTSYSRYGGRGYYEYSKVIDFVGWRLITIPLDDEDGDGQPDALKAVDEPSITNIGEILVGIRNDTQFPIRGEIWVNEIHLSDPYVKSGWARRFNLSTELADIFNLRAGYARQDKDFENSAGQTGRTSRMSMGYSTSNYDYNVDTGLNIIPWLPLSFSISHRESESRSQFGMISSYESGLTTTDNKTFSVGLDLGYIPDLSFSYDKQRIWNERRGTEISDLYSSDLGYSLGRAVSLNMNYSHEVATLKRDKEDEEASSGSYYYYGRDRDSITDSGSISLQISPAKSFSINPTYDVRRELERELSENGEEQNAFSIASRDQRLSLRPTLRKFLGFKPSISGRYGFSEDWFRGEKDVSINTDFGLGLNITFRDWFRSRDKEGRLGSEDAEAGFDSYEEYSAEDVDRLMDEEGFREMMDGLSQEERGNWIEQQKDEMKAKLKERTDGSQRKKKGILRRSVESFSLNTDLRFNINDYLRRLKPDMGFMDIINLDPESEYRNRSTRNTRLSVRSNIDPLSWMSLGSNISRTNRFTKSAGTASNSDSSTVGGDVKFFNSKNSTSLMLKYDMTTQDSTNRSGRISDSTSHNQSVMVRKTWASGVGSSLGLRTTFRNYERGGVETHSKIFAPNFNIDYDLHVKGELGLPLIGRVISMDHNLDVSNTFSSMVRREKLGVNRDEKSEQYGTSLDVSYDLRQRIRATMRLSVDYNHDRVEENADYLAVSGSLMLRGEFR